MKLSEHFTLGELCKTSYHTLDGNIPSRVAIENLKNICENWLEDLRFSYNELYGEGVLCEQSEQARAKEELRGVNGEFLRPFGSKRAELERKGQYIKH